MATPTKSFLKVDVDASFNNLKKDEASGIIVRDYPRFLVSGSTSCFPTSSTLMAEAILMCVALYLVVNLNLERAVVESDVLILVSCCKGES